MELVTKNDYIAFGNRILPKFQTHSHYSVGRGIEDFVKLFELVISIHASPKSGCVKYALYCTTSLKCIVNVDVKILDKRPA